MGLADEGAAEQRSEESSLPKSASSYEPEGGGLRLGYTINLNLPATSDVAVFDAIFRSLKEHLL